MFYKEYLHSLDPQALKAFLSFFQGLLEVSVAWIPAELLSRGFLILSLRNDFRLRFLASTPPLRSLTALLQVA